MKVNRHIDTATGETVGLRIQEFDTETVFAARDYSALTIKQTVELLMNVYSRALKEFQGTRGISDTVAYQNAAQCWKAELPELIDRKSVLAYIACIAWGQRYGAITPTDAKLMMFMAQTQLTALKTETTVGTVGKIDAGSGAAMVRHDTGADALPPIVFCQSCGNPVGRDVQEVLGDFCSHDCMTRRVRHES